MLEEYIKDELDKILKKIEAAKEKTSTEELNLFVDSINSDIEKIIDFDLDKYIDLIYENNSNVDKENYKKQLDILKKIVGVKKDTNNPLFFISVEFEDIVKSIIKDAEKLIEEIKENNEVSKVLSNEKEKFENVILKINNKERLNEKDLEIVNEIIGNITDQKERILLLDSFCEYNSKVKNIVKEDEKQEEKKDNKDSAKKITVDVLKNIVDKSLDKKQRERILEEYDLRIDEVIKNADFSNASEVLKYLDELGISNRFEPVVLLAILTYSNVDSIKKAYDELKLQKLYDEDFVYEIPGFWVEQSLFDKEREGFSEKKNVKTIKKKDDPFEVVSLKEKSYQNSRKDMFIVIEVLRALGKNVDEMCKTLISKGDADDIIKNYETFNIYNITEPAPTSFLIKSLPEKCDSLIECGLLDPRENSESTKKSAFVNRSSTWINYCNPGMGLLLQDLYDKKIAEENGELRSDDEVKWDDMFSEKYVTTVGDKKVKGISVKTKFSVNMLINDKDFSYLKTQEGIEKYKEENGLVITNSDNFDKFDQMEKIAYSNLDSNEDEKDDFIKYLDDSFGVSDNKFIYIINNHVISRLKVLRIYNNLKDNEDFSLEEIKFFALTYGKYFDEESYEQIKEMTGYSKGGVRS